MVMSANQLGKFLEKASKGPGLDHMRFVMTQLPCLRPQIPLNPH